MRIAALVQKVAAPLSLGRRRRTGDMPERRTVVALGATTAQSHREKGKRSRRTYCSPGTRREGSRRRGRLEAPESRRRSSAGDGEDELDAGDCVRPSPIPSTRRLLRRRRSFLTCRGASGWPESAGRRQRLRVAVER
jgi:hypothetical protein